MSTPTITRTFSTRWLHSSIVLHAQHLLVIRSGPQPTCIIIPNAPQHDCFGQSKRGVSSL